MAGSGHLDNKKSQYLQNYLANFDEIVHDNCSVTPNDQTVIL